MIVYDAMTGGGRRDVRLSCLSSLNIMLEPREGFEADVSQCERWLRETGFVKVRSRHLVGPTTMVWGRKPGG